MEQISKLVRINKTPGKNLTPLSFDPRPCSKLVLNKRACIKSERCNNGNTCGLIAACLSCQQVAQATAAQQCNQMQQSHQQSHHQQLNLSGTDKHRRTPSSEYSRSSI